MASSTFHFLSLETEVAGIQRYFCTNFDKTGNWLEYCFHNSGFCSGSLSMHLTSFLARSSELALTSGSQTSSNNDVNLHFFFGAGSFDPLSFLSSSVVARFVITIASSLIASIVSSDKKLKNLNLGSKKQALCKLSQTNKSVYLL